MLRLMGAVAEAVGKGLGPEHVIGVIPAALEPREVKARQVGCAYQPAAAPFFLTLPSLLLPSPPFVFPAPPCNQLSGSTVGELRVVKSMHERKAIMFDEAGAFITIPGGVCEWLVVWRSRSSFAGLMHAGGVGGHGGCAWVGMPC
jgi:predicted Rossmann-fold nucleotide-binding protein